MLQAEVAVEGARRLDRETYTYEVPAGMDVVPGHRVLVPFGRRQVRGYVTALVGGEPAMEVKPIHSADIEPLLLPHQVELARSVAAHYWAPLIEVLGRMIPPRVRRGRSTGEGESSRQRRHSLLLRRAAQGRPAPAAELTPEQAEALAAIRAARVVLLQGVAGSGKTEVYLAAAAEALAQDLRVLVLVPEISLSPLVIERLARLGAPVGVLHSRLTDLERAQEWWRIRRGEARLIVGSRSAVFAPIPALGLICLDEEGASGYKQDQMPRYETGWVARRLAEMTGARLVLGSATPSVGTYHAAIAGEVGLARLRRRFRGAMAKVDLVDMRDEVREGNRSPLSRLLTQLVDRSLQDGEQAILFLNRRGLATWFACRDCAHVIRCPGCSVAMVQHEMLVCHYCGYALPVPESCPSCGSRRIRGMGMGTQRLEGLVRKLWPAARVLRLDRDTARGPDAYIEIFEAFASGAADVLVGTQLVAKGFDVERVTTVGVVDADLPLHFPDYRSAEGAFSLVCQVAGRAGRGARPARVVVQTSNPEHYALRRAAEGDYEGFYADEIAGRRMFGFPPFRELAVMTFSHTNPEKALETVKEGMEALTSKLVGRGITDVVVQGPSPAFIPKLRDEYRWQITIKGPDLDRLRLLVPDGRGWSADVDPGL